MTPEQTRGRQVTLAVAILMATPPIFNSLILLSSGVPAKVLSINLLPIVLAVRLYMGHRWSRIMAILWLLFGATICVLDRVLMWGIVPPIISILFATMYMGGAAILWRSQSVRDYFDFFKRADEPLPSLKDFDGV
jgi:hypothetical protein